MRIHMYANVHIQAHMYVSMNIYIHTYILHTYIHVHICRLPPCTHLEDTTLKNFRADLL